MRTYRLIVLSALLSVVMSASALVPPSLETPLNRINAHWYKSISWQNLQEQYAVNYGMWDEFLDWFSHRDWQYMEPGVYHVGDSIEVTLADGLPNLHDSVETHIQYAEVIWVLRGVMMVNYYHMNDLMPLGEYNAEADVAYYTFKADRDKKHRYVRASSTDPKTVYLFMPTDPHRFTEAPEQLKKLNGYASQPARYVRARIPYRWGRFEK